ncbi:MAG: ABC transporter substrate-binding protein [Burkholderiales bacterium]
MSRRASLLAIAGGLLVVAAAAALYGHFRTARHVPRVAVIYPGSAPQGPGGALDQFKSGLREAGYVDGESVVLDVYVDDGDPRKLAGRIEEWVRAPVDVILAGSTGHAQAARAITSTVPIVFAVSFDPVGDGVVTSLARPGGNATGLSIMSSDLEGKRIALLKDAVPGLARMGLILDATVFESRQQTDLRNTRDAAQAFGIAVVPFTVKGPQDFAPTLEAARDAGVQALMVQTSPMLARDARALAEAALDKRMPVMFGFGDLPFANTGALLSYGASIVASWQRSGNFVARILRGENPANMPVEQPTRFVLTINTGVADRLGLKLPSSLLLQADNIVK